MTAPHIGSARCCWHATLPARRSEQSEPGADSEQHLELPQRVALDRDDAAARAEEIAGAVDEGPIPAPLHTQRGVAAEWQRITQGERKRRFGFGIETFG